MAKKTSTGKKIGIGAGVAVAALGAAAGAYFFASKNAKGHRAKAKKLYSTARSELVKQAKKLKKMDKDAYDRLVGQVMKGYAALKSERPEELVHVANELKAGWKAIEKEVKKSVPKVKAAVKRARTLAAKKKRA